MLIVNLIKKKFCSHKLLINLQIGNRKTTGYYSNHTTWGLKNIHLAM